MAAKIDKNNLEDIIGLTGMQEGLLVHQVSNPHDRRYFDQITLNISGHIDIEAIKRAWYYVSKNNEVLRSVFRWEGLEKPVQVILKEKEIPFRVYDIPKSIEAEQLTESIKVYDRNSITLTENPFIISVCRQSPNETLLIISAHRILYDGWSNGIILKEFLDCYHKLLCGEEPQINAKTKYKEFIKWYEAQDKDGLEAFWRKYLEGFEVKTSLPFSNKSVNLSSDYNTHRLKMPKKIFSNINSFIKKNNITLATLIYSAWGILLQQCGNLEDIVFGTTVSGRPPSINGVNDIVGLFINTIPLRMRFHRDDSMLNILKYTDEQAKARFEHEQCPLALIKKASGIGNKENLFDSIIVIENYPLDKEISRGEKLNINSYSSFETTNFPLTIQVIIEENNPEIQFIYDNSIFRDIDINRISKYFLSLLTQITNNPDKKLHEICILSEEEKERILYEFNNTKKEYPRNKSINRLVEEQAEKTGSKIALQFGDETISYRELNARANRLARMIIEDGVKPQDKVVLMLPRSVELIVSMLAVLKSGAVCIPLDIEHPAERINFIIQDCESKHIIKAKSVHMTIPEGTSCILYDDERIGLYSEENLNIPIKAEDLAFIIYTSGSTGNPKGTLLNHGGIICHVFTKISVFGISSDDVVANNFSLNVIASLWQIFAPLFRGGKVVIYTGELETDPYKQMLYASKDGITVIELIPSTLNTYLHLLDQGKEKISLPKLRKIGLTSEETKPRLVNRFYSEYYIPLVNCYGQTECSDDVLHYHIPISTDTEIVPVGTPAQNTQIFILSKFNHIQPVGVPGEICVSGESVSKGYLNRPEITREKFVQNPFFPDTVMYRTGDVGRWLENGCVEYLGRIDHQVKIRGNRIELREIENCILKHIGIIEAAVIVNEDKDGERQLYAFFTSENELTVKELRSFLAKYLPDYMIPVNFVRLDKFPLTANGKIDKKKLKNIKGTIAVGSQYVPPRNVIEKKIGQIWRDLLNKEKIGVNDNFFDLGGHSLLMIQLKAKLQSTFKKEFSLVDMFNYPTVSHLAEYIQSNGTAAEEQNTVKETEAEHEGYGKDIAVIGIAMRVPGARNVNEFWNNLMNGTESILFFKEEEVEHSNIFDYNENTLKLVPAGGVLEDADLFDAEFFNISPKEAEIMDPQHRVFLEHCWMALEDAGYNPDDYPGSIGVFAGAGVNTYLLGNILSNPDIIRSQGEFQTIICNDKDFLATKVSYKLNLRGPSVTVQTACSTSLVAIHLAKQSLLNSECDMALAGGVSIRIPEKTGHVYVEGGHLSPDGHCYPFDAKAHGTVFSNGAGVVVLKRLSDALNDRDHIYAVIKGSAINNDGAQKVGYTSPSEKGQIQVINKALSESRVDKESIGFIETHGTGTVLGDPIEFAALAKSYKGTGDETNYCALGSVKANLGHLDAAAGVTGFIKAIMTLKRKIIPPQINYDTPNSLINLKDSPFFINTSPVEWKQEGQPRRAAVSSLGIGGTNAHVILEEAESILSSDSSRSFKIIVLSARSESALKQAASNLAAYLKENSDINLADAAYTLKIGRKRFDYGLAAVCRDVNDTICALESIDPAHVSLQKKMTYKPSVVFMFPGAGEYYPNMACNLYKNETVFKESIDSSCEILRQYLGIDLRSIIYSIPEAADSTGSFKVYNEKPDDLNRMLYPQIAVFITEMAVARLWLSWGISPKAMFGYDIGEYAAACLSGVLSYEDALFLVCEISKLAISMEKGAIKESIRNLFDRIKLNAPVIPYISGVTSTWILPEQAVSADYWSEQFVSPICLSDGISELIKGEFDIFLEIGPGNSLAESVCQHPYIDREKDRLILSSLPDKNHSMTDEYVIAGALSKLWLAGADIDWKSYYNGELRNRVALPVYPFERSRYWINPEKTIKTKEPCNMICNMINKSEDIKDWFYVPVWKQCYILSPRIECLNASWLIFADDAGIGMDLAVKLKQSGCKVVLVKKGSGFEQADDSVYSVNPDNIKDYTDLFNELKLKGFCFNEIVHMWNITEWPKSYNEEDYIKECFSQGIYSLLHIVRSLSQNSVFSNINMRVVSSFLNIIESTDRCDPAKSVVLAACRVISQEYPHIRFSCVDIGNISSEWFDKKTLVSRLFAEFTIQPENTCIAYRNGIRWIRSYEKNKIDACLKPVHLRERGVYMITGGLGNIGLDLAEFFAKSVKARLVLVTRSDFSKKPEWKSLLAREGNPLSPKIARLMKLEALGAEILILQADCANEKQMDNVFKTVEEQFGTVNGVIHAAGITGSESFKPISEIGIADCEAHFGPKVYGTIVLEKLLRNRDIDFCILFSSISSILGGLGFYSYSAANLFMDKFVEAGKLDKWLSISWCAWNYKDKAADISSEVSDLSIDAAEGIEALRIALALAGRIKQLIISKGDLISQLEQWSFIDGILKSENKQVKNKQAESGTCNNDPHFSTYPLRECEKVLVNLWKQLIGTNSIGLYDDFFELGGHSLMATRLVSRLREIFKVDFTLMQFYEEPTINGTIKRLESIWESAEIVDEIAKTYIEAEAPLNE